MPPGPGQSGFWLYVSKAQARGSSFNQFYRGMVDNANVFTQRRSTMLDYWNEKAAGTQYRGSIGSLRAETLIPKRWMIPRAYPGRTNPFLYTVSYRAREVKDGAFARETVSVASDRQLTVDQVLSKAQKWAADDPSAYGVDAEDFEIDMVEDAKLKSSFD